MTFHCNEICLVNTKFANISLSLCCKLGEYKKSKKSTDLVLYFTKKNIIVLTNSSIPIIGCDLLI